MKLNEFIHHLHDKIVALERKLAMMESGELTVFPEGPKISFVNELKAYKTTYDELVKFMEESKMKKTIARFEKVSYLQFSKDMQQFMTSLGYSPEKIAFSDDYINRCYKSIKIPTRATEYSAGYDFYLPMDINLKANEKITIPTGIRCRIDGEYFLAVYPKSGLGVKNDLKLSNTVGIIDADYYGAKNEGHIMICINTFNADKALTRKAGESFCQGIFQQYFIAENDTDTEKQVREGGFDSTNK